MAGDPLRRARRARSASFVCLLASAVLVGCGMPEETTEEVMSESLLRVTSSTITFVSPTEAPPPAPAASSPAAAVSFRTCREARAAGAAPVYRGQPGYGDHLDPDGDGVGCET